MCKISQVVQSIENGHSVAVLELKNSSQHTNQLLVLQYQISKL